LELLESLALQQAEKYAHELVTWLCGILEKDQSDNQDCNSEKIAAAQAGVAILKFMKKHDLSSFVQVDDSLYTLQMISALQKEYSLFLSVEEYQIPEIRNGLFDQYLQQYLGYSDNNVLNDGDEKKDPQKISNEVLFGGKDVSLTKLFRLGELVGVSREEVRQELMLKALSRGDVSYALNMCRELTDKAPCESTACSLYKVALNLCEKLAEGQSIVTDKNKNICDVTYTIHQLLCQATTHCSPGK